MFVLRFSFTFFKDNFNHFYEEGIDKDEKLEESQHPARSKSDKRRNNAVQTFGLDFFVYRNIITGGFPLNHKV